MLTAYSNLFLGTKFLQKLNVKPSPYKILIILGKGNRGYYPNKEDKEGSGAKDL
jgi:hypothetical protein